MKNKKTKKADTSTIKLQLLKIFYQHNLFVLKDLWVVGIFFRIFLLFYAQIADILTDIMEIKKFETKLLFEDGRLTGDGAFQLLNPYFPEITGCINSGLNAFRVLEQTNPEVCLCLVPRSRACIIHDHMEDYARRIFSGMEPDIMLGSDVGFLIVDFQGKIKMRFKKLSFDLRPYNVKTNQQQAYDDQTLFAPPATLVTAGYRLDSTGVFRDAQIVCWAGSELRWSVPLPCISEVPLVFEDVSHEEGPPVPIVVPKKVSEVHRKRGTRSVS